MPHLQYICIDIFWRCLQITGTTFDRTVVWFQWTSNGDGRKGEREQEERKRKEKALADTFWPFPNESTEKFFGNNKSNNWIMIQKIDWTRGFARRKSIVLVFAICYFVQILISNWTFVIYAFYTWTFFFSPTMFSMEEMHKTTTLSSTTSIFVCISFHSPSCYLLIKTEKKNNNFSTTTTEKLSLLSSTKPHRFPMYARKKCQAQLNSIRQMSKMQCLSRNWLEVKNDHLYHFDRFNIKCTVN